MSDDARLVFVFLLVGGGLLLDLGWVAWQTRNYSWSPACLLYGLALLVMVLGGSLRALT